MIAAFAALDFEVIYCSKQNDNLFSGIKREMCVSHVNAAASQG